MPLYAYNLTGSPVTLAGLSVVLPASASPPSPGQAFNVTAELHGLTDQQYAALEAQRPDAVRYLWTEEPEYSLGSLVAITGGGEIDPFLAVTINLEPATPVALETITYYIRDDGDDSNDGLTENTAFATMAKAKSMIPLMAPSDVAADLSVRGRCYVIDTTNHSETTLTAPITFPPYRSMLAGTPYLTIKADPISMFGPFTATAGGDTYGEWTLTYGPGGWLVNHWEGFIIQNEGTGQWGVITGNSNDTLYCRGWVQVYTGDWSILQRTSVYNRSSGNGAALRFDGNDAGVTLRGLELTGNRLGLQADRPVNFIAYGCLMSGFSFYGGVGTASFYACYVRKRDWNVASTARGQIGCDISTFNSYGSSYGGPGAQDSIAFIAGGVINSNGDRFSGITPGGNTRPTAWMFYDPTFDTAAPRFLAVPGGYVQMIGCALTNVAGVGIYVSVGWRLQIITSIFPATGSVGSGTGVVLTGGALYLQSGGAGDPTISGPDGAILVGTLVGAKAWDGSSFVDYAGDGSRFQNGNVY